MEAWKRVKSNNGSYGVDGKTIAAFEADLKGNLYKIWNRMSSGTYFPHAVKTVEIPKKAGGVRKLGIPTVSKELASRLNPTIRGWIEYYGKFNRSEFNKVLRYLDLKIVGWVKRKYRKHGSYTKRPIAWLGKVANSLPDLFAHWKFVRLPAE